MSSGDLLPRRSTLQISAAAARGGLGLSFGLAFGLVAASSAHAAETESLHVWLTGSSLEEAAASAGPVGVPPQLTGGVALQLTTLTYCGPATDKEGGDKGKTPAGSVGRFLAFVEPPAASNGRIALDAGDCKAGVAATAARLAGGSSPPEGALVEIRASTRGSTLKAAVHAIAVVRGASDDKKKPSALEALAHKVSDAVGKNGPGATPLAEVPLKDIPLELAPGRKVVVNAQAGFVGDGVEVVLTLADKRSSGGPGTETVKREDMSSGANARFSLGWELAAEVLKRMESAGPFVVDTQQESFEVSRLSLSGNGAGAKAKGNVRARSVREDFQLAVGLSELDLKVSDVSVEPNLADCGSLGLLQRVSCSSQNAARSAAASAASSSVANRYQGRLVSQLLGTQNLRFDLQGMRFSLRLEPLSFMSAAFGLLGTATVKVEAVR